MTDSERVQKLNELFVDYVAYLIFMARQIIGGATSYGHFALIKALEKILEIQQLSEEIENNELYEQILVELKSVHGTSSGDVHVWEPFLDKLILMLTKKLKNEDL